MPYSSSMTSAKIWNLRLNFWIFLSGKDRAYKKMYVCMHVCMYVWIIVSIHVSLGTASLRYRHLHPRTATYWPTRQRYFFVCLYVCMYVCMCVYVVNMCTLYDITNVWNGLGCLFCLQPPLPLRRRHQHPDLPWWVLHSLVWWVCMLATDILVCM